LDIKKYESITKIGLDEDERAVIAGRVAFLTESFDELERFITDAEPLVSVLDIKNVLREDKTYKLISRDVLLSNTSEHYNGCFLTPKTIE